MFGMSAPQLGSVLIGLFVVMPVLVYLCIKAATRARNEERYEYFKKLKGDFDGEEKEKK